MIRMHSPRRSHGFSLLEVMVAVIVICVGLLGIAKLQALSLSNATTSRLRALAAIQTASLASAMHSNREYWGNTPPATVTVTASPTAGSVASSDAALQTQAGTYLTGSSPTNPTTACIGASNSGPACSSLQLAAFDLARWSESLAVLLPNPAATISCPAVPGGGPASCTITVGWTEQAVAAVTINQQSSAAAQCTAQAAAGQQQCFEVPTYTLYVEP